MMTTISLAKKKWARKMANAGVKWKKAVTDKKDEYAAGLKVFNEGRPVGPTMPENWAAGVGAVSAEDFQAAVAGKEEKWARRLAEAIAS